MHHQHMQYVIQQPHGQQMYQQYGDMPQYQGYNQQQGQDFGFYDGGSGDYADKHQVRAEFLYLILFLLLILSLLILLLLIIIFINMLINIYSI